MRLPQKEQSSENMPQRRSLNFIQLVPELKIIFFVRMPCFYWRLLIYLQLTYHFTNVDPNNHIMNLLVFFSCPIGNTVKPYLNVWMKIPKLSNTLSQVLLVASIDHLLLVIEIAFTPHQIIKEEIIQPRLVF